MKTIDKGLADASETPFDDKTHEVWRALNKLLLPYTITDKYHSPCLRLRVVKIRQDKDGGHLIEVSDLIDAIWDAAERTTQ